MTVSLPGGSVWLEQGRQDGGRPVDEQSHESQSRETIEESGVTVQVCDYGPRARCQEVTLW